MANPRDPAKKWLETTNTCLHEYIYIHIYIIYIYPYEYIYIYFYTSLMASCEVPPPALWVGQGLQKKYKTCSIGFWCSIFWGSFWVVNGAPWQCILFETPWGKAVRISVSTSIYPNAPPGAGRWIYQHFAQKSIQFCGQIIYQHHGSYMWC